MFCSACGTTMPEDTAFCSKCGTRAGATPAPAGASSSDNDKLFAIAAHLGGIFFGFIPSLVVFLIRRDSPGWVLDNAREALNWQITMIITGVVCFILSFVLIGIFLFWIALLVNLVLCIIATVKASGREAYRYPFCIRLIK